MEDKKSTFEERLKQLDEIRQAHFAIQKARLIFEALAKAIPRIAQTHSSLAKSVKVHQFTSEEIIGGISELRDYAISVKDFRDQLGAENN